MKKIPILLLITSVLMACKEEVNNKNAQNELTLEVLDRQKVNGVSSLSGFEAVDSNYFAVSDNTAFLYILNQDLDTVFSKKIIDLKSDSGIIINKSKKPDFEALTYVEINGKKELLIFGSGSKSPDRNLLIRTGINENDSVITYKLDDLYLNILNKSTLHKENMNIEGVVVKENKIYLFNRGNNAVWEFDFNVFMDYIEQPQRNQQPDFKEYCISLPKYQNVQASFSGATAIKGSSKVIFTASLEDTQNWIDDGNVLGSYIGIIEIDELKDAYEPKIVPIAKDGKMLKVKVESSGIISETENSIDLLLVTDEDGEISEAIKIRLTNL